MKNLIPQNKLSEEQIVEILSFQLINDETCVLADKFSNDNTYLKGEIGRLIEEVKKYKMDIYSIKNGQSFVYKMSDGYAESDNLIYLVETAHEWQE